MLPTENFTRGRTLKTMKGTAILIVLLNLWITSHALDCKVVKGSLKQIDAGNGQVFGVNSDGAIYTLYKTGWTNLPGSLKHVTVGPAGVWGVNSDNTIYKLVKGEWVQVPGQLKQTDAGGSLFIAGVNMSDDIYCLNGEETMSYKPGADANWVNIQGKLKYYSCGPYSCWGVNDQDNIYIMKGVSPTACAGSMNWELVPGSLSMIEVSTDGEVYGVNSLGDIYYREGTSPCNPTGTGWNQIQHSHKVKHVSYDLGHLWLIGTDDRIAHCLV
ncbi:fish-egg lectin-like [Brachyhypopomus gauderio]|uniref:fish-egg lectin-like n=1 Tax=Brachyhypopomus gauderio TaxID=698409 RepID=UPI004042B347